VIAKPVKASGNVNAPEPYLGVVIAAALNGGAKITLRGIEAVFGKPSLSVRKHDCNGAPD